jgi:hypothetical protein
MALASTLTKTCLIKASFQPPLAVISSDTEVTDGLSGTTSGLPSKRLAIKVVAIYRAKCLSGFHHQFSSLGLSPAPLSQLRLHATPDWRVSFWTLLENLHHDNISLLKPLHIASPGC